LIFSCAIFSDKSTAPVSGIKNISDTTTLAFFHIAVINKYTRRSFKDIARVFFEIFSYRLKFIHVLFLSNNYFAFHKKNFTS
jgi:hypothetical protein